MAPSKKVLFRVIGALVALGVVGLAAGAWWVSSLYQSEQTDTAHASAAFAEVRARFPGLEPAFEIREARLVVLREPADAPSPTPPAAAHMLVWQTARAHALAGHTAVVDVHSCYRAHPARSFGRRRQSRSRRDCWTQSAAATS